MQDFARGVVLAHHHRDSVACGSEEWSGKRLLARNRLFHRGDVREQDLFLFRHAGVKVLGQVAEEVLNPARLGMVLSVSQADFE